MVIARQTASPDGSCSHYPARRACHPEWPGRPWNPPGFRVTSCSAAAGRGRVGGEDRAQRGQVGGGRGGVDVVPGYLGVLGEKLAGLRPPLGAGS